MKSAEEIIRMHSLFEQGWSKRRIAAELGISRNTLERYLGSRSDQAGHDGATKNKLKICLDWLKEQALTGEENSEMLRQRLIESGWRDQLKTHCKGWENPVHCN